MYYIVCKKGHSARNPDTSLSQAEEETTLFQEIYDKGEGTNVSQYITNLN